MADPTDASLDASPAVTPTPNGSPNGSPDGEPGPLDVAAIGAQMSDQFVELLGLWMQQMTALAQVGIDPTPLLQSLAYTLRSTAEQLDPQADDAPGGGVSES